MLLTSDGDKGNLETKIVTISMGIKHLKIEKQYLKLEVNKCRKFKKKILTINK